MKQNTKKILWYVGIFLTSFLADRLTKLWAIVNAQEPIIVCKNLNWSLSWNRGVSWSFFNNASVTGFYLLTFVLIAMISIFAIYAFIQYKNRCDISFEVLMLSGALSNIADRFCYGAVADFIDFYVGAWHWPTFNLADTFIFIGVFAIVAKSFERK